MARSNSQGRENEYVLGTLNDDSDEEIDDGVSEYESKTLKQIMDTIEEVEKINRDLMNPAPSPGLFENYAEFVLQLIIKLDDIDTKNSQKIRDARKEAILIAQTTLEKLDYKMKAKT